MSHSTSQNVIGQLRSPAGCANPSRIVAITTPFNGFGPSGGERAPGVAILVGLAKDLAQSEALQPCVEYVFGFVSGHNEGSLGLRHMLQALKETGLGPANVSAFFTLGANIGLKYRFDGNNYQSGGSGRGFLLPQAVPQYFSVLSNATNEVPYVLARKITSYDMTSGDTRFIYAAGYKVISWQGLIHPRFHMATDYATSVDPAALEAAADMITKTVVLVTASN